MASLGWLRGFVDNAPDEPQTYGCLEYRRLYGDKVQFTFTHQDGNRERFTVKREWLKPIAEEAPHA